MIPFIEVQSDWKGETVALIASGPSLAEMNLSLIAGCRTVVANDSITKYPHADVALLCDRHWVAAHPDVSHYLGPLIITLRPECVIRIDPRMVAMERGPHNGLSRHNRELAGNHSWITHGLCFAQLKGAKRVLLLGVDLQPGPRKERHFHEPTQDTPNAAIRYATMARSIDTQAGPLKRLGVEVINCSPRSRLNSFTKMTLEEAMRARAA